MAPERERPTRRQIKEGRPSRQAADRLAREADRMQHRSDELGEEIEHARSDWQRKRASEDVPGAPPLESQEDSRHEPSYPTPDEDEQTSGDTAPERD